MFLDQNDFMVIHYTEALLTGCRMYHIRMLLSKTRCEWVMGGVVKGKKEMGEGTCRHKTKSKAQNSLPLLTTYQCLQGQQYPQQAAASRA